MPLKSAFEMLKGVYNNYNYKYNIKCNRNNHKHDTNISISNNNILCNIIISGLNEIRTHDTAFKVPCANRYTIRPKS